MGSGINRREFLRRVSLAGGAILLPPSMVWPHKKIFIPPVLRELPTVVGESFLLDLGLDWDEIGGVYRINERAVEVMYSQIVAQIRKRGLL